MLLLLTLLTYKEPRTFIVSFPSSKPLSFLLPAARLLGSPAVASPACPRLSQAEALGTMLRVDDVLKRLGLRSQRERTFFLRKQGKRRLSQCFRRQHLMTLVEPVAGLLRPASAVERKDKEQRAFDTK